MSRIGIITDATCDISEEVLKKYNVPIIPIKIHNGEQSTLDVKSPDFTKSVMNVLEKNGKDFSTSPCEPEEIKKFILKNVVLNYDYVLAIMPMETRTKSYQNTIASISKVLVEARPIRNNEGMTVSFMMNAIDSGQISTGLGLSLLYAMSLINHYEKENKQFTLENFQKKMKVFNSQIYTLLIPAGLGQLYNQAAKKGDKSVGLASYLLGSALDIKPLILAHQGKTESIAKIKGLEKSISSVSKLIRYHVLNDYFSHPVVNISYGGDVEELKSKQEIRELVEFLQEQNIKVFFSQMSATLMINLGMGGVAVSFAARRFEKSELN